MNSLYRWRLECHGVVGKKIILAADPPAADAPKKSEAELLYEKLFEANTKQADAAYFPAYSNAAESMK